MTYVFAISLICAACVQGQTARRQPAVAAVAQEEAAVARTVERLMQAVERLDIEQVEALHAYGPSFSKFDEDGLGRQDGDRARTAEREGLARVQSFDTNVRDLKVDVFGTAAVATCLVEYVVRTDTARAAATVRSTLVFAKREGGWRIVHEHHSPLASAKAVEKRQERW